MLRGINVGAARRIAMAQLRALLQDEGFGDVATHGQSGNVALHSGLDGDAVAVGVSGLIVDRFGFAVAVTVRRGEELAEVIAADPIAGAASDPRRYQVTFLPEPPTAANLARLRELVAPNERLVVRGRELYSHHPDGIARSPLAAGLTHRRLGPSATVRNWTTVQALHQLVAQ